MSLQEIINTGANDSSRGKWADILKSKLAQIQKDKSKSKHDTSLLGWLNFKLLMFDVGNMKEIHLSKEIIDNYDTNRAPYLFRLENGTNALLYVSLDSKLNAVTFGDDCRVLHKLPDLFPECKTEFFHLTKPSDKYLVIVDLEYGKSTSTGRFRSQDISFPLSKPIYYVTLLLDENMNFIKHVCHEDRIWILTANSVNIILVKEDDSLLLYDSEFNLVEGRLHERVKDQIDEDIHDLVMNDQNLFILCETQLKTFDLKSTARTFISSSSLVIELTTAMCLVEVV